MAPHTPTTRRAALAALVAAAGLLLGCVSGVADATAPTPFIPRLGLSWTVLIHRCATVTHPVRVRHGKKVTVEKKRKRVCGLSPRRTHSRAVHLRWRQYGAVFGHLTLAKQPIANATITITSTIAKRQTTSSTVTTNSQGRFAAFITAPSKTITVSYSPSLGHVIASTKHVEAEAHLSLKVGHLTARRSGRFSGIVLGGYLPQNLYIQFLYYAGNAGWQPFSHLAIVNQHNGHWATRIPIPRASAGYDYRIKATVVPSPDWPWARTDSNVVIRRVS